MVSETIKDHRPIDVSLAEDPYAYLQRLFCYFLQSWFAHEEFVSTGMHWTPDEETTELIITSEKPILEALNKRPHLVCVLGSAQWSGLGLDQLQRLWMSTGQRRHTDLMPMTVSYHCQSKSGNECRRLAWYSSFGTIMFRRMIQKFGRIFYCDPKHSISAESSATAFTGQQIASDEHVSVVVTVPFYWQPQWTIRDPAVVLQKIKLNLRVGNVAPLASTVVGRRPGYSIPLDEFPRTFSLFQTSEVSDGGPED